MKPSISFRRLILLVYIITIIPLLAGVGLIVFRLQQTYLVEDIQNRLVNTVQTGVKNYVQGPDLTVLAQNLGEQLRAMGADMFVLDAQGNLVMPALGTGQWLDPKERQTLRETKTSSLQIIGEGTNSRLVYLAAIADEQGSLLGNVEASVSLEGVTNQLNMLSRWILLIISLASVLSAVAAFALSGVITKPLGRLVEAVLRARSGNLEARAPIARVRELGQLAEVYNQMLDRTEADFKTQEKLVDNMRRFIGDASHELRSPLAVFKNSVDLLEKAIKQGDEEQILLILDMMRVESDSMANLVDSLLLLARLDQPEGTIPSLLQLEEIHPLPFLEEAVERARLFTRGQKIELTWPRDDINSIVADREMLRRALNNILENAVAYTPAGKHIFVSLMYENGLCCFMVQDEGIGIPAYEIEKIFNRFYRGDESRNRRIPGTGLGLSIANAVAGVHGGSLKIQSKPNEGTRALLCLPSS